MYHAVQYLALVFARIHYNLLAIDILYVMYIGEGDWNMVVMESSSLAAHWAKLGSYLGLQSSYIDVIRGGNPLCPSSSWSETLSQWIKQNYSTRAHGLPSWRTLLRAIAKVDKLLFQKLAIKHGK